MPGAFALDLGCGDGKDVLALADFGLRVHAVDSDASKIASLQSRLEETGKDAQLNVARIEDFSIEIEKYDVILASNSLPFITSKKEVFEVLKRAMNGLKIGGFLYFSLFGVRDAWSHRDTMSFYSEEECDVLLRELGLGVYHKSVEEGNGLTMKGDLKHWHIFKFFLRKN